MIPGVAITTDIITGFPGETEAEFSESLDFVKTMDFANGHIFTYSAWPGTPAAHLPHPVPLALSRHRNARMREVLIQSAFKYREKHLGQRLKVLWEKAIPDDDHRWRLSGLSDNYLRVGAYYPSPCLNQLMNVQITGMDQLELVGNVTQDESQLVTPRDTL